MQRTDKKFVARIHGEFVSNVKLPLAASRAVVIIASFCGPWYAWMSVQALADLAILPNDMETDAGDLETGLCADVESSI